MLTPRGRVVLSLAVALLVAGRILGVTELFGLAAAALAVVALGASRVRAPQLRIAVSTKVVPPVLSVGDAATLEIAVENSGTVPTPSGRLQLLPSGGADGPVIVVPRLVPGEHATVSLKLTTERRGRHQVSGFDAVLVDALATARRRITSVGASRYGVRPLAEPLPGPLPSGGGGADLETTLSSAERLRSGASLLRPYIAGDDLRRVHWPTTARVGDLMVREGGDRERDASSGITLVLSPLVPAGAGTDDAADRFEEAVRIAASVLSAAEREGSFHLIVPGDTDTGEATGSRHLDVVLEALTDLKASPVRPGGQVVRPVLRRAALEDRVVLFIAACSEPSDMAGIFGAAPETIVPASSAAVLICAGCDESSMEPLSRRVLAVRVARGGSLGELWSSGDAALVRA